MTALDRPAPPDALEAARAVAADAARRAGVRIEAARDLAELRIVCDVVDEIWRPPPGQTTVRIDFLRALTHAGNYCVLAWDDAGPVGVCFGFLSVEPQRELHSHIAGVVARGTGRHVGRALKFHQRAWALEHGLATIGWTYDPLVRRNAFFNASRLGALPVSYLVDFYGSMDDSINSGQATDRVKVSWPLTAPAVAQFAAGTWSGRPVAELLAAGAQLQLAAVHDRPFLHEVDPSSAVRLVQVPRDIEGLRRTDPGCARDWRLAVRHTLGALLDAGWTVTQVDREGHYVLENKGPGGPR